MFAAAVVATLALGLAPNCVIFAVMDAIYFRPLPYPSQDRLALLNVSQPERAVLDELDAFTLRELQGRVGAFQSVAAYRSASFNVNAGNRPERFAGQFVTADFFRTLAVQPALGRSFTRGDVGGPPALIIGHRVWRDYFSGRPDIIGLAVRVDAVPSIIVGVMPAGFTSFMEGRAAQVWAPMAEDQATAPAGSRAGNAIARLAPGASPARAADELAAAHAALARQFPDFYRDRRPVLRDFRASLFGGFGPGIRLLSIIVGLLLLIACGNAANLLLGRAVQRSREIAVRTALGAGRLRLATGLLAESLLLAGAGNLVALLLAYWGLDLLWARTAPIFRIIGVEAIAFDRRVFLFSVLLTLLTTVLFGALPALHGTRADLALILRQGGPGSGRHRRSIMSRTLVVSQVALCVFTLVGTMLVFRSFLNVSRLTANPGFESKGLLIATLPQREASGDAAAGARLAIVEETMSRVAGIPGVQRVALADRVPFLDAGNGTRLFRRMPAGAETGQPLDADVRVVSGDFFQVLSIPLRRGRFFATSDNAAGPPVIVISDRMATTHWGAADPLGDRLLVHGTWRTIVGVVGSTVQSSPLRPTVPAAFVPYLQSPAGDPQLLVRSDHASAALGAAVRKQVRAVDPDQPLVDLRTMDEALNAQMLPFRLILVLMAVFGTIALSLSAVGLYGVMAHDVSRRTHEMGVRMAVGAGSGDVVRMVVRDGLRLAAAGLAIGLLLGAAAARILPSELFGARGLSIGHYAGAAALWLGIAVMACLVPARRAARVDPLSALHCE